ncbi:MAG: hypothetical protein ACNA7J_06280 [Wenzhouxiangella sp.]
MKFCVEWIVVVGRDEDGDLNLLGILLVHLLYVFSVVVVSAALMIVVWMIAIGPFWLLGAIDSVRSP